MRGKKILFVSGSMRKGGAERVISILANYYAKKGWKVVIGLLLFYEIDYELEKSIQIINLTCKKKSRIRALPYWLVGIRKTVKSFCPDVIVAFVARINIVTQISCIALHKRIIVSERNDPCSDGRNWITVLGTSILYPYAAKLVLQTKRSKDYFGKKIQDNSVIIPNPVRVYEYASSEKQKKIVSVGRLAEQKNQKLLVQAFAKVNKIFPNYELWIYGEGELRNELENLAKNLGISEKVFLPGTVNDIHHQIANADVFVLTSDYEGLSNALLEALMMGLPCISTNCAGSDEVIVNGENGILIPIGNQEALVSAILELLSDTEKRERMGKAAYNMAQRYGAEIVLERWAEVIDICLNVNVEDKKIKSL